MSTGYTKIFSDIVTSTIWQTPNDCRVLWITLLALKDEANICRATVPALAKMCDLSLEQCEAYLLQFQQPDKYSRSQDFEGRRIEPAEDGGWFILNGQRYRDMMRGEERKVYVRAKVAEHRARVKKAKANVNYNPLHVTDVNTVNHCKPIVQEEAKAQVQEKEKAPEVSNASHSHPVAGGVGDNAKPVKELSPEQKTVCDWFNRRHTTPWDERELKAWKKLTPELIADGIAALTRYYTAPNHVAAYKRRDLLTLLNNWRGEIDRYRDWRPGQNKPTPKHAAYDSTTATAGMTAAEIGTF